MCGIPDVIFRAHWNDVDPLAPSLRTGGYRWDDFRPEPQFHVLYTGDSVEGCFIEKLQKYAAGHEETNKLLADLGNEDGKTPQPNTVPASVLHSLAASALEVLDLSHSVAEPFDVRSLAEISNLGAQMDIGLPNPLKAGHLATTDYTIPQRISVIVFEQTHAAGIVSRSSLDDPLSDKIHRNYNLYRALPELGAETRVPLRRIETRPAMPAFVTDLRAAFGLLGASPALPLEYPGVRT
jgi:hypothetical protein